MIRKRFNIDKKAKTYWEETEDLRKEFEVSLGRFLEPSRTEISDLKVILVEALRGIEEGFTILEKRLKEIEKRLDDANL